MKSLYQGLVCTLAACSAFALAQSAGCNFPFEGSGDVGGGSTESTSTMSGGGGSGGSGAAGGSTSTATSAGGNGGAGGSIGCTCVPAVAGATYYQLAQVAGMCTSGTPVTTLLDCDACSCEPACSLQGNFDDDAACSGNGFISINGVTGCLDNANTSATVTVYLEATVTAACTVPTAVSPLSACQLDPPAACDNGGGVCLPQGEPVCVVVNDGDPCPTGFDATMRPIQEGGTCDCDCTASGTCPAEARVYSDNNCTQGEKTVAANCAQATDAALTVVGSIQPPDPSGAVTCTTTNAPTGGTAKTLCCAASP